MLLINCFLYSYWLFFCKMYDVKSCGVKFKPCSLLITYVDKSNSKLRCRQIPLRNFKKSSNVGSYSNELKKNQRHCSLLKAVSQLQIEKMLLIIQAHMKGRTTDEAVQYANKELTVDPEKDLCKLEEAQVDKAKKIMDKTFEEKQIKPDDPNFQYDVEVEFNQPIESSGWDSESDGTDVF